MPRKKIKKLIDVAMGRTPADLVLRHGTWVCVQSGEFVPATDVAIIDQRIAYVGPDASHTIGRKTVVLDTEKKYLVPGLLDGHVHIESGMLTVTEFVRAVLPTGTTGLFIDPHEIANVFGLKGVRLMVDEARQQPIHVWVEIPSCVPSAPGLETPGDEITPDDVAKALTWEGVIGLGEMMNYPGVVLADPKVLAMLQSTQLASKVIGGHYASPDLGLPFHGYVAGGPEDDHEGTRQDDAVARIRQGMKVMLRHGSAWQDLDSQILAITKLGLDPHHFILCTDDCHAETLVHEGHMDRVVRQAISLGLSPMTAIQMATINTAEHFNLDRDLGQIAPGRWADILLVNDMKNFHPDLVIAKGSIASDKGRLLIGRPEVNYPDWSRNSVHLRRPLESDDFHIPCQGVSKEVRVNVIGVIENQAMTRRLSCLVKTDCNEIKADLSQDLAKIAIVERHRGTGKVEIGLVTGFGFQGRCAIASTVAHDCHHMILLGTDDEDMVLAANKLAEAGGGQIVVREGKVIGMLALPIGGLMSAEAADQVSDQASSILEGFRTCGCKLNNPNMTMSLLALVVIPEIRLSDKGLVDVNHFSFIPLIDTSRTVSNG